MVTALLPLLALVLVPHEGRLELVTDEAEAVLRVLTLEASGRPVPDGTWRELFATDGYRRLKAREQSLGRKFDDADFRTFASSVDLVAKRSRLERALRDWSKADLSECRRRAAAYLPEGAQISAKIYILIKPQQNSFVFEVKTNPAIMLYLDPGISHEAFAATIAHEMHHIGYGTSCPSPDYKRWLVTLAPSKKSANEWLGGFGEGFAVLAAANGTATDPQAWASPEVQAAWRVGMANQAEQFRQMESFFLRVASGKLDDKAAEKEGMSFFGIVGPWYTVGYTIATTIEKAYGRDRLIACFVDPRQLLSCYNSAVKMVDPHLPVWSPDLLSALK